MPHRITGIINFSLMQKESESLLDVYMCVCVCVIEHTCGQGNLRGGGGDGGKEGARDGGGYRT
jgi:hypothetical protein